MHDKGKLVQREDRIREQSDDRPSHYLFVTVTEMPVMASLL
jgi:hypothetical protein